MVELFKRRLDLMLKYEHVTELFAFTPRELRLRKLDSG